MNVTKNKIKQLQTGKKIHDGRGLYFFKKGDKGRWSYSLDEIKDVMRWDVERILNKNIWQERNERKKMLSCGLDPIMKSEKMRF